ncbi:MAG: ATP-binding protein [Acidobacteriota bacterium]
MSANPAFVSKVDTKGIQDEELRQRLLGFRARYNWSLDQISRAMQQFFGRAKDSDSRARNVGLGPSTVYAYSAGKWMSGPDALARFENRLRAWLDHREHGGKETDIDMTVSAAKAIQHGLAEAHRSQKFVTIVGQSGMGKSLLLRHFANARTTGAMVLVEAYHGMTAKSFLAAIVRALGEVPRTSKDQLLSLAAGLLAEQPKLLAIDEANFLTEESINHLVYIWNQSNIGIALLGTEELDRVAKSSKLQRLRSRLKLAVTVSGLTDEDVRRRLEESFDKKEVTARVLELARHGSFGSYRDLDTLIESANSYREAAANAGKSLEQAFEGVGSRTFVMNEKRR